MHIFSLLAKANKAICVSRLNIEKIESIIKKELSLLIKIQRSCQRLPNGNSSIISPCPIHNKLITNTPKIDNFHACISFELFMQFKIKTSKVLPT